MSVAAIALAPVVHGPMFVAEEASRFSASEIREAIAHWVGQGRMDLAEALVAAGLSQYPDSEDILALGALVCEVQQDWAQAQERLEHLMGVQGERVPAETWHHFIRVLRCRGAYFNAYLEAQKATARFPRHEGLALLHGELQALMESVPVTASEVQSIS